MFIKFFFLQLIIFNYAIFCKNSTCLDESCNLCSMDGKYCFRCKDGFIRHYNKCGKSCSSIMNCLLCDAEEKKCIRCRSNCIFNGVQCDCTERYIVALFCIFFSLFMIIFFFGCLMNRTWRNFYQNLSILSGRIPPNLLDRTESYRNAYPYVNNLDIENRINDLELERDFNKNKIILDRDIAKIKCFICKNNSCNLKFGCGCYICFECEKKCVKDNICLNCNKNIESMQQVSCSICFANKKEFSFFNCTCKNVVCKECYIKWRKQNNICPFCRRTIII